MDDALKYEALRKSSDDRLIQLEGADDLKLIVQLAKEFSTIECDPGPYFSARVRALIESDEDEEADFERVGASILAPALFAIALFVVLFGVTSDIWLPLHQGGAGYLFSHSAGFWALLETKREALHISGPWVGIALSSVFIACVCMLAGIYRRSDNLLYLGALVLVAGLLFITVGEFFMIAS